MYFKLASVCSSIHAHVPLYVFLSPNVIHGKFYFRNILGYTPKAYPTIRGIYIITMQFTGATRDQLSINRLSDRSRCYRSLRGFPGGPGES